MSLTGSWLLKIGGFFSILIGVLHIAIIFIGAPAYRYFGAGEQMANLAESGSILPAVVTFFIAVTFAVFGIYAFSGAEALQRLPALFIGLIFINIIYILRGLLVIPQIIQMTELRQIVFSLVSLGIGLTYLIGTIMSWDKLVGSNSKFLADFNTENSKSSSRL